MCGDLGSYSLPFRSSNTCTHTHAHTRPPSCYCNYADSRVSWSQSLHAAFRLDGGKLKESAVFSEPGQCVVFFCRRVEHQQETLPGRKLMYLSAGGHVERSGSWDVAFIFVLALFFTALLLPEEQWLKVLLMRVCT